MHLKISKLKLADKLLLALISLPVIIVSSLIYYSALQVVNHRNDAKKIVASSSSSEVIDKIERNFYERFGDVQAFAYNKLAQKALSLNAADSEVQDFINTMTNYYVLYDLMMICNIKGEVIAVNTTDKNRELLKTEMLVGKSMALEDWFKACIYPPGPDGGAFYSDFNIDTSFNHLYNGTGLGMDFSAPVRNAQGDILGVWRNRAGWKEVTQTIRDEAEKMIQIKEPDAFIVIMNEDNTLIDAANFAPGGFNFSKSAKKTRISYNGNEYDLDNYIIETARSKGAYTYKGKGWVAITIVPRASLQLATFLSGEWLSFLIYAIVLLVLTILAALVFTRKITARIKLIHSAILQLSRGKLVKINEDKGNDEIADINKAFQELSNNYKSLAEFASTIEQGNFNADLQVLSAEDMLGNSLLKMKNALKSFKEESEVRNKFNEGLARFIELSKNNTSLSSFLDQSIAFVIKHLGANQGCISLVEEDDGVPILELRACYAYDRKKYITNAVKLGEGLAGQCALEKGTIHITNLPKDYPAITSGLGEALPRNLLIVPMLYHQEVMGVIELASFVAYRKEDIVFIEKIAEICASSILSMKVAGG